MNIVDAHLHFWQLSRGDYGWLMPDLGALYRDFVPADIDATLDTSGVDAVVVVQAAPTEAETRFLLDLAQRHPRIACVVGWTDFEAADAASRIANLRAAGNGVLKGFRPMVQDIADISWLMRPELDAAFEALIAHDLTFDALVKPEHLPALEFRLQRHPSLRTVLDHAGKPAIGQHGFDVWADAIARLAKQPQLVCKLSGLLTEVDENAPPSFVEPVVAHVFACFGPERVMWGSDWPVLTQRASYTEWLSFAQALVARHAPGHEQSVFSQNARRFYRLDIDSLLPDSTRNAT